MQREIISFAQRIKPDFFDNIIIKFNPHTENTSVSLPYQGKSMISLGLKNKHLDCLCGEIAHEIAEIELGIHAFHHKTFFKLLTKIFSRQLSARIYYYLLLFNRTILLNETAADKRAVEIIKKASEDPLCILLFLQWLYFGFKGKSLKNFYLKKITRKRIEIIKGLL